MKSTRFLAAVAGGALLCAWFAVSGIAQQSPGGAGGGAGQPPPPPPQAAIKAGAQGLYVLRGANLAKLNSNTLAQVGVLQLIAKPPTTQSTASQQQPPPPPGVMAVTDEKIIVVLGDQFFSVDAATFMVGAKVTLPKPQDSTQTSTATSGTKARTTGTAGQTQGQQQGPPPPVVLELHGTTVYVICGPQIIALNINDGTILGQTTLPKPEAPTSK